MKKYIVRLENEVTSVDFGECTVEAPDAETARKLALTAWEDGKADIDWWTSEYLASEISMDTFDDWEVTEIGEN